MQTSLTQILERADELYAKRSDIAQIRLSVDLLNEAEAYSFEAAWRLSRALFFLGQEAKSDDEARLHHSKGVRAAVRAVKLRPECVEGHFWLGVNLALKAGKEMYVRALLDALCAKHHLRRAIRIDKSFHAAGPLRVMGRLQSKLPYAFGGGKRRARHSFDQALELSPHNTVTRMYLAELLMDEGKISETLSQLVAILDVKIGPEWSFETERDRKTAQELIHSLSNLKKTARW